MLHGLNNVAGDTGVGHCGHPLKLILGANFVVRLTYKGCLQKKKLHMEGKVPFWGGEGVRKKGQISQVKEQKK